MDNEFDVEKFIAKRTNQSQVGLKKKPTFYILKINYFTGSIPSKMGQVSFIEKFMGFRRKYDVRCVDRRVRILTEERHHW